MLIVKEDKTRNVEQGQIFVELTENRGLNVSDCNRLGYWCDKSHLRHFILELSKVMPENELKQKIIKNNSMNKEIESEGKECCGSCKKFKWEDTDGWGFCTFDNQEEKYCGQEACVNYSPEETE